MTEPHYIEFEQLRELASNPFPLGRNVKHDSRSRNYSFGTDVLLVDTEVIWTTVIGPLNQLDLGSCTGNAGTAAEATDDTSRKAIRFDAISGHGLDEDYAVQLYSDATRVDPFQGDYPPVDTGSDGLSIAKVLKQRGIVNLYEHIFSFNAAKAAILRGPFITGVNWYQGMFVPDSRGVVTISGSLAGGHEFLVRGRTLLPDNPDDPDGPKSWYWLCRNSWGDWGLDGDFLLSDSTYARLLSERGDATVLHWVVPATPEPQPSPEPPPFSFSSLVKSIVDWLRRLLTRT